MSEMSEAIARQETADMLDTLAADPDLQVQQEAAFQTRWGGVEDVRTLKSVQVHLPQGVDQAAFETLERLRELERRYAAPHLLGEVQCENRARICCYFSCEARSSCFDQR